jgi:hypothetical protein
MAKHWRATNMGYSTQAAKNIAIERLMLFENGEMEEQDVLDLFQELVDSGLVWKLQGSYGRMAQRLIDIGSIKRR